MMVKPLPKGVRDAAKRRLMGLSEQPKLERWNLLGTGDLATPLPPIPWVCEPLGLAPGAVSLVAGYGYSRKTMAMQSLGLSVASGKSAWGLWSVRKGPFVHLDYEQGRRLTQERYQRLARGMGFGIDELQSGALRVACMPRAYLDEKGIIDELVQLVGDAAFVLVDSLRAAFPHADENSSEVRAYLDVLSRVSESTGAAIAVIHHARKPNAQNGGGATHAIRGSSALFDACQSVYVFEGEKDTPTTVHHQKDRVRGATLDSFGLVSEDVAGASGPRDGLVVRHLEAEQMAVAASARMQQREDRAVMKVAEQIARVISEKGPAGFQGSRKDIRALARRFGPHRTDVFDLAWVQLTTSGALVRSGPFKSPTWIIGNRSPSLPIAPPFAPRDRTHSVTGPPFLKNGDGMDPQEVAIEEPSGPRPRLLEDDERMFSDPPREASGGE
jgi:hypothetical protein